MSRQACQLVASDSAPPEGITLNQISYLKPKCDSTALLVRPLHTTFRTTLHIPFVFCRNKSHGGNANSGHGLQSTDLLLKIYQSLYCNKQHISSQIW
jgi:hypothetical protein